jgi:exopolysaccharide biosynthesis predicted pyruvyltransferase EpsI
MRVQPPVEQWLRAFLDAEFVVTDSFHACVFSIIFGKPFIAVGNAQRGNARFNSLLKMFGLEHHLIATAKEYSPDADFSLGEDVAHRLGELRAAGYQFLKKSL